MLEIIVFFIIIAVIVKNNKKKGQTRQTPPFTAGQKLPAAGRPASPAQGRTPSASACPVRPAKSARKKPKKKERKKIFSAPEPEGLSPIRPRTDEPLERRTFIEPTKPYRPAHNAGERYEEWMPVPEGKRVCRCGYCGADNLIPKHSDPGNFTCYFCREEL